MRPSKDISELQLMVKEFTTLENINLIYLKEVRIMPRVHLFENYEKRPRDGDCEEKTEYIPINVELSKTLSHCNTMLEYVIPRPFEFRRATNESTYCDYHKLFVMTPILVIV